MSSRHTRRKAALQKALDKAERIVQAHKAWELRQLVDKNKREPNERNYYPPSINSVPAMKVASNAFFYREPRASGGMGKRGVQALRAKGASFGAADMLTPDSASLDGQVLDGRAIREEAARAFQAQLASVKGKK